MKLRSCLSGVSAKEFRGWVNTFELSSVGVKEGGLIHLHQSIMECGTMWERGMTLDKMAFST